MQLDQRQSWPRQLGERVSKQSVELVKAQEKKKTSRTTKKNEGGVKMFQKEEYKGYYSKKNDIVPCATCHIRFLSEKKPGFSVKRRHASSGTIMNARVLRRTMQRKGFTV